MRWGAVYVHAARWLYKHKLQPDVKLDTSVLPRMWKTLVFSMVVVIVPLCVMEGYFASIGRLRTSPELPGFKELLLHMVAFTLIEEVHMHRAATFGAPTHHSHPLARVVLRLCSTMHIDCSMFACCTRCCAFMLA